MAVDYLGFAQIVNQNRQTAQNRAANENYRIADMLQNMTHEQQIRPYREAQISAMQSASKEREFNLADIMAKQDALKKNYGGGTLTDAYTAQMKEQQQIAKTKAFFDQLETFDKTGMAPESVTSWAREQFAQDPGLAKIAPNLTFISKDAIKMTMKVGPNQIKNPMKPDEYIPEGMYELEGKATGNPLDPYRYSSIKPYVDREEMQDKRLAAQSQMLDKRLAAMAERSGSRGSDRGERLADKQRERVQRRIEGYKKKMDEVYATEGDSDTYRTYRRGLQNVINEADRQGIEWDNSSVGLDLVSNKPTVPTRKSPVAINMKDPKVQAALKAGYTEQEIAAYLTGRK